MPRHSRKSRDSSSSSSSSSESETEYKIMINKKHRHRSESENSSSSECEKKSKSSKCSNHSDSDVDKSSFDEIYKYYKCRLLQDPSLMVGGSDSYIYSTSDQLQTIAITHPVDFNNDGIKYNVQHKFYNSPFVVRTGGIYIIFFCSNTDQSSQFTLFINGQSFMATTTSNNAGAGQTVFRHIVRLEKNDTVVMRNYSSNSSAVTCQLNVGGLQLGHTNVFLMAKIAALPNCEYENIHANWDNNCLSRRKRYLFKKLSEKLVMDSELMVKGFNVHGTFYTTSDQTIPVENDVNFSASNNCSNLTWNAGNGSQVVIQQDGIYKVFFFANTVTAGQFAFAVNGIPYELSTQGSNRGAGQITIRTLLELKTGDVLTVKNHTSANGFVALSANNGGPQVSVNAILTVFKLAPIVKADISCCQPKKSYCDNYELFRSFLLSNRCLQLTGSSAYIDANASHEQDIAIGQAFDLEYDTINRNVVFEHGIPDFVVKRSGIYDLFIDIVTDQPAQLAIFVNGLPEQTTITGRESGGNRSVLRQFLKLNHGDIVNVRNWESHSGTLTTNLVTGGSQPGHPVKFSMFLLYELDNSMNICMPHHHHKPCHSESESESENECKKDSPKHPPKCEKPEKPPKCEKPEKPPKCEKPEKPSKCDKPSKGDKRKCHKNKSKKHASKSSSCSDSEIEIKTKHKSHKNKNKNNKK
jgi:hypothetical protein